MAASPVLRANRAQFFILGAEVWGTLQVDQFILPHRPDVNVFRYQLLACPHGPMNHLGGRQVFGLKVHGYFPEVLESSPASPYGAGSRYTMAFALHHHRLSQYLKINRELKEQSFLRGTICKSRLAAWSLLMERKATFTPAPASRVQVTTSNEMST